MYNYVTFCRVHYLALSVVVMVVSVVVPSLETAVVLVLKTDRCKTHSLKGVIVTRFLVGVLMHSLRTLSSDTLLP